MLSPIMVILVSRNSEILLCFLFVILASRFHGWFMLISCELDKVLFSMFIMGWALGIFQLFSMYTDRELNLMMLTGSGLSLSSSRFCR